MTAMAAHIRVSINGAVDLITGVLLRNSWQLAVGSSLNNANSFKEQLVINCQLFSNCIGATGDQLPTANC
jgi:hypothetical protein